MTKPITKNGESIIEEHDISKDVSDAVLIGAATSGIEPFGGLVGGAVAGVEAFVEEFKLADKAERSSTPAKPRKP